MPSAKVGCLLWFAIINPGKNKFGISEVVNIKNDCLLLNPFFRRDLIARYKIMINGVMGDMAINRIFSILGSQ